jgi:hypothetical protein
MEQVLWFLMGLGLGLALDFVLVKVMLRPLKERVLALELESQKVLELESELKWKSARVLALESDLDRVNSKLMWRQD